MFVYMRRMIISPKLKREVGIFQKGKIRRDFATREIQIKVHVTCLTPPNPFATLPKRAVKSSISQKKNYNVTDEHI